MSRSRLYQLRADFLQGREGFEPAASGGDRRGEWPPKAKSFLENFLPLQNPPNYQLVADELDHLAGRFVTSDTTWNHFEHFREAFGKWGLPEIVYTDGLSLFGPSSSNDHSDPLSEFQRAFRGLGVAHSVAPSPQAKGKIERRFGTFQRRLVTLLSHARATTWKQADVILQMEIARQNRTVNRSTGSRPLHLWQEQALSAGDDRIEALIEKTLHSKPKGATRWSTRKMAKTMGISHDSVSRIWRAFGLKPHRADSFQISTDPQYVDKVRDVAGLYRSPPENALVLSVDEKSPIQALERSQPVLPMHYMSVRGVVAAIRDYLDAHNLEPKPFVWSASADRIFEKTANFCKSIV